MQTSVKKYIRAIISNLIVALIYTLIIILILYIALGSHISEAVSLVDRVTIVKRESEKKEVNFDVDNLKVINYPKYGTQYGRLIIDSIDVDLPLYFGDSLEILKKGIGHYIGSYFPRRRWHNFMCWAQL